jgi:TetR/AcrR family transcriptional regulator, fatty acid metabolism regulator protein
MNRSVASKKGDPRQVLTDIRREQFTTAAYRVVSRKGYSNFTVADVAREAGLSVGLIHYYFNNKQELLLHLFKETQRNVHGRLLTALEKAVDPLEKLEIFIDQSFLLFQREKDYFHLLFEFWTEINRNENIRNMVQRLYQAYRDELSGILRDGMGRGVFTEMDIVYTATLFISIVQHTIIQHLIDEQAFDFNDYARRMKAFILKTTLR